MKFIEKLERKIRQIQDSKSDDVYDHLLCCGYIIEFINPAILN